MLPGVQQVVVVPRLVGEVQIFVAVGCREDSLQRLASREFILGHNQASNIIGREVLQDGSQILKDGNFVNRSSDVPHRHSLPP